MRSKILTGILVFLVGLVAGQKLMVKAYDPAVLEEVVLQHIRSVYTTGCVEGIMAVSHRDAVMLMCIDMAEKTVKDQEDIMRNEIWGRQ